MHDEVVDGALAAEDVARRRQPQGRGPPVGPVPGELPHRVDHPGTDRAVAGELPGGVDQVAVLGAAGQQRAAAHPVGRRPGGTRPARTPARWCRRTGRAARRTGAGRAGRRPSARPARRGPRGRRGSRPWAASSRARSAHQGAHAGAQAQGRGSAGRWRGRSAAAVGGGGLPGARGHRSSVKGVKVSLASTVDHRPDSGHRAGRRACGCRQEPLRAPSRCAPARWPPCPRRSARASPLSALAPVGAALLQPLDRGDLPRGAVHARGAPPLDDPEVAVAHRRGDAPLLQPLVGQRQQVPQHQLVGRHLAEPGPVDARARCPGGRTPGSCARRRRSSSCPDRPVVAGQHAQHAVVEGRVGEDVHDRRAGRQHAVLDPQVRACRRRCRRSGGSSGRWCRCAAAARTAAGPHPRPAPPPGPRRRSPAAAPGSSGRSPRTGRRSR